MTAKLTMRPFPIAWELMAYSEFTHMPDKFLAGFTGDYDCRTSAIVGQKGGCAKQDWRFGL